MCYRRRVFLHTNPGSVRNAPGSGTAARVEYVAPPAADAFRPNIPKTFLVVDRPHGRVRAARAREDSSPSNESRSEVHATTVTMFRPDGTDSSVPLTCAASANHRPGKTAWPAAHYAGPVGGVEVPAPSVFANDVYRTETGEFTLALRCVARTNPMEAVQLGSGSGPVAFVEQKPRRSDGCLG